MLSSIHISEDFFEEKNWHIPPHVQIYFSKNHLILKNLSDKSYYLDFLEKGNFTLSKESISHPLTGALKLSFGGLSSLSSSCCLLVLTYKKKKRLEATIKVSLGEEKLARLPPGTDSLRVTLKLGAYETLQIQKIKIEDPLYEKLSGYLFSE